MNFTLALLGGLVLILPGLAAVVIGHAQSGRDGVRRTDLPLTSIIALLLVVGASLFAHLAGWLLIELGLAAARELKAGGVAHIRNWVLPDNPYLLAVRLAEKRPEAGAAAAKDMGQIVVFVLVVLAETALAAALAGSRGLILAMKDFDAGNQGWVFQNVVLPTRHGVTPVAFVLTNLQLGSGGLAYRGVVVEVRQSPEGELRGLTLSNPDTFLYTVPDAVDRETMPRIRSSGKRSLDGVLSVEATAIRNILVQPIPDDVIDDIVTLGLQIGESPGVQGPPTQAVVAPQPTRVEGASV